MKKRIVVVFTSLVLLLISALVIGCNNNCKKEENNSTEVILKFVSDDVVISEKKVEKGYALVESDFPTVIEKVEYDFSGWYMDNLRISVGFVINSDTTIIAKFSKKTSEQTKQDGSKEYPYMIEIFSKNPDFIILEDDAVLTPLPIDDEISSLSAILLNEAYYELLKTGQMMVDGIPVLSPTCLIPFKAKAWLDLKERKLNGEQVDSKNIKKHKNDVFRLAQLITANTRQALNPEIAEDMKNFLSEMIDEEVDLKSLGIKGTDSKKIIEMLYQCYGLKDY